MAKFRIEIISLINQVRVSLLDRARIYLITMVRYFHHFLNYAGISTPSYIIIRRGLTF